jgi:hypothetical protein
MGSVSSTAGRAGPAGADPAAGGRGDRQHRDRRASRRVTTNRDRLPAPLRAPRPGWPQTVRRLRRSEILQVTLTPPPPRLGITHWSTRLVARELGVSHDTVARVWREHGIQPWRVETFKFSTDPELVAKVRDVVGLYLHPPERAVVLCVDEKSQIQALERTQPLRRVWPGRPEQRAHDYGMARPRCSPRSRSPQAGSLTSASRATVTPSSPPSSSRSPEPTRAASCT